MRGGQKTKTSCGAASKIYYERQLSCLSLGIPVVAAMSSYGLPSAGPSGQEHRSSFRALRSRARIRSLTSWGDTNIPLSSIHLLGGGASSCVLDAAAARCRHLRVLACAAARYPSLSRYPSRDASSCVLRGHLRDGVVTMRGISSARPRRIVMCLGCLRGRLQGVGIV